MKAIGIGGRRLRLAIEKLESRDLLSVNALMADTTQSSGSGSALAATPPALVQTISDQLTRSISSLAPAAAPLVQRLDEVAAAVAPQGTLTVFNVRDYGAVGDGSTNDTAAITAALNDAHAAGGGIVYFPTGIYVAQGLPLYQNVYHVGAGAGATTIELPTNPTANLFQAPPAATFQRGGFNNLTLSGQGTTVYDGISFANITQYNSSYELSHVEVIDFRNGYYGAPNAYQTMISESLFASNQNAGVVAFENPYIVNSRFNGNVIGLSGRLADAFLVGNYFSSNSIGAMPSAGEPFRQSTFTGNVFVGNTWVNLAIDDQNTVTANVFEGSLASQSTLVGILVRGNANTISANIIGLESGSPTTVSQDFLFGGIVFSPTDYRGQPQPFNTMGYNTVITGNFFACQNGRGILGFGVSFVGMTITNNSFDLWNQSGIVFADASRLTYLNNFSNNTFIIKANTSLPAIEVDNSLIGNVYMGNQFLLLGGITAGTLVQIDARDSIFLGNRASNLAIGELPWNFLMTDARTKVAYNLATNVSGVEVQPSSASGMVSIGPTATSINVTFASPLLFTPTADDFNLVFASNPYDASAIWVSNLSSTGFTINLNSPPGGGYVNVAWKVVL
jgi:hypothetical protein